SVRGSTLRPVVLRVTTATPGTTPPLESRTTPVSAPSCSCAPARPDRMTSVTPTQAHFFQIVESIYLLMTRLLAEVTGSLRRRSGPAGECVRFQGVAVNRLLVPDRTEIRIRTQPRQQLLIGQFVHRDSRHVGHGPDSN